MNQTPFELLTEVKMRHHTDYGITKLLNDETREQFIDERTIMREEARDQILKVQKENRKQFNKRRQHASQYQVGDLVAIKRTHFGPGLKLKSKYLGPYQYWTGSRRSKPMILMTSFTKEFTKEFTKALRTLLLYMR